MTDCMSIYSMQWGERSGRRRRRLIAAGQGQPAAWLHDCLGLTITGIRPDSKKSGLVPPLVHNHTTAGRPEKTRRLCLTQACCWSGNVVFTFIYLFTLIPVHPLSCRRHLLLFLLFFHICLYSCSILFCSPLLCPCPLLCYVTVLVTFMVQYRYFYGKLMTQLRYCLPTLSWLFPLHQTINIRVP